MNVELVTSGFTEAHGGGIPADPVAGTMEQYPSRYQWMKKEVSRMGPSGFTAPLTRDTPLESDFESTPATITVSFESGELSKQVSVGTQDDTLHESNGQLTVRIARFRSSQYHLGTPSSATTLVKDDDIPTISIRRELYTKLSTVLAEIEPATPQSLQTLSHSRQTGIVTKE